ncbi:ParB family chromosome partitioning protein [Pseudonocardia kunmingensis]|uniref:ParB family chromosome partitioning protein n=2 Tax=Pseudonocardia kunmingensis TaxID=630975 RepID=A0A543CXW0_9PSEU|nr:ParB family chromosome partitioning protein [Pseudonocardia kunmingensis]
MTTSADPSTDHANTGQTDYPYLLSGVDPRTLRAVDNLRDITDIREQHPDLVASIAENGMNPLVSIINVTPDPDGCLAVLVGFHRTAAAVAVKEVENPDLVIDVLVHAPGTTRREVKVAQGLENLHHKYLTQADEARLYDQLALEGLDDFGIAETLVRPIERVRAGRAVAADPRTHAASVSSPDIDLLALAHLLEFADDADAHQELVEVLDQHPRDLDWAIRRLRRQREQRDQLISEAQRLTDLGYTVLDGVASHLELPDGAARFANLCAADGDEPIDPAQHASCPGRAAYLTPQAHGETTVAVTEVCADYATHGHRTIAAAKQAAAEEQLREAGVAIVDFGDAAVVPLTSLYADEHAERCLTVDDHASCPGHAAVITPARWASTDVEVCYVCTDYADHGHVRIRVEPARADRDAAWQSAERRRAAANNRLWRAAKIDRRDWIATFFTGWRKRKASTLPPRIHHWLALGPVLASNYSGEAASTHTYACTLLGFPEPSYRRDRNPIAAHLRKRSTTEIQAVLIRLAQIVGACEQHFNLASTDQATTWREPTEDTRFYFELLAVLGYPLSHVEQLITNPDLDIPLWPHLAPDTADDTADDTGHDTARVPGADPDDAEFDHDLDDLNNEVSGDADEEPAAAGEAAEPMGENATQARSSAESSIEVPDSQITSQYRAAV